MVLVRRIRRALRVHGQVTFCARYSGRSPMDNWRACSSEHRTRGFPRGDSLRTLRTRLSAAYKGVHALLMRCGAEDFRSGQPFDQTVFFDENVDIHHVFPRGMVQTARHQGKYLQQHRQQERLCRRGTNRIIGGVAPSTPCCSARKGRRAKSADRCRTPVRPS